MVCHFKGRIVCRLVLDELDKRCITSKVVADYAHREAGIFSIEDVNDFHLHLPEKIVLYVVEPEGEATAARSGGSGGQGSVQTEVSSKSAMAQPAAVAVVNIFNLCGSK